MPEPIPESMPEPVIEPTPEASPAPAQTPEPVLPVFQSAVPVSSRNYAKIIMWVLVAAVVLLAVFVVVARLNPGLMDNLLYTPEQLEILNQ